VLRPWPEGSFYRSVWLSVCLWVCLFVGMSVYFSRSGVWWEWLCSSADVLRLF
jgi:hypothetical protein